MPTSMADEFLTGSRAFAFIVHADCPACDQVMLWFVDAAEALPGIEFAFVSPSSGTECEMTSTEPVPIIPDTNGLLGDALGVTRAPTVIVASADTTVARLDWPFSREDLFTGLAAAHSRSSETQDPPPHLATRVKDLVTTDLDAERIALTDLPLPMLLAFLHLGCPACRNLFPLLQHLSADISVAVVASPATLGRLSISEREALETLREQTRQQSVTVLIASDADSPEHASALVSPTFLLVDRKGVIIAEWEGVVVEEELRQAISLTSTGEMN